jgi:hypothetical protein
LLGEPICDAFEESHVGRMRHCCRGGRDQEVSLLRKSGVEDGTASPKTK